MPDFPDSERRLGFGHFVDRVFWAIISGAALFMSTQMREVGQSISELNQKVAVVIEHMGDTDRRIGVLETERKADRKGCP